MRDKIKVYSWIGGDRPADVANNAREVVARGFKAIKMNGCEEMQIVDSYDKVDKAVATIAAIREAVGPDIGIGVDFHGRVHKPMAKVLAKELDPYKLMFIEEPVLSENQRGAEGNRQSHARRRSRSASGSFRAGISSRSCPTAMSTSSSPTCPMPAASPNAARSRPWPKPTTWRWRRIARWARSRWPPACSWMLMTTKTFNSSCANTWKKTATKSWTRIPAAELEEQLKGDPVSMWCCSTLCCLIHKV